MLPFSFKSLVSGGVKVFPLKTFGGVNEQSEVVFSIDCEEHHGIHFYHVVEVDCEDSEVCNLIDFTLSPDSLLLLVNHCQLQRIQGMESTQALLVNKGRLKRWSLQLVYTPSLAKLLTLLTPPIKLAVSRKYVDLQV